MIMPLPVAGGRHIERLPATHKRLFLTLGAYAKQPVSDVKNFGAADEAHAGVLPQGSDGCGRSDHEHPHE